MDLRWDLEYCRSSDSGLRAGYKMPFRKNRSNDQGDSPESDDGFDPTSSRYFNMDQLVEVRLQSPKDFLRVRETLTRMGIQQGPNTLTQICYIFFKQKRYFVVHVKELMMLDGQQVDIIEDDIAKRNLVATLLSDWKLVEIVNPSSIKLPVASMNKVRVIPYKEKENWNLVSEYNIGK